MATRSGDGRETERVLRLYEKEARKYDREMNFIDRLLFGSAREWVCAQATGEVLEIGIGTDCNLPHYRQKKRGVKSGSDGTRTRDLRRDSVMKSLRRASPRRLSRVRMRVRARSTRSLAGGSFAWLHAVVSTAFPGLIAYTARRRSPRRKIASL